jgi:long-chain acyl-CoA synthetase
MTETSAPTHYVPFGSQVPVDPASGSLAIGVPTPGTDAMILSDEGQPAAAGVAGELLIRGPQVMLGYRGKPEETASALANGWMHTGDIAVRDDAGWFYIVDRKKDVIIASGFKVWPREVEDCLYSHPLVREAAVVGVEDDYRGESVKAVISLHHGAAVDPADVITFRRTRLTGYKVPRIVEVVDELPKTLTGKIQRNALREAAKLNKAQSAKSPMARRT